MNNAATDTGAVQRGASRGDLLSSMADMILILMIIRIARPAAGH